MGKNSIKMIKLASETKEHFYELIDTIVESNSDVITIGGKFLLEKNKTYVIDDIEYREGYFTKSNDYQKPELTGIKIRGIYGIYGINCFKGIIHR